MRSLAAIEDWLGANPPTPRGHYRPEPPDYRLRALPREDVHVYVKKIDNTRVARVVDRKDWFASLSLTGATLLGSVLVCALVVPSCLGMLASRRIEYLRAENTRLQNQMLELTAEEARLLSPSNVEQWAGSRFVAPPADGVMYVAPSKEAYARLDGNSDSKQAR